MIFRAAWPGMPQEVVMHSLRLLGEEVQKRV
jgi:hypothetical protein